DEFIMSKETNYIKQLRKRIELTSSDDSITNESKLKSKYDFNVPNTNLVVKREIIHLTSLEEDIFYFVEQFRETVLLTCWDNQTSLSVLSSIISDNLRKQIMHIKDCETALEQLLRLKYTKELAFYYNDLLGEVTQEKFFTIKKYKDIIINIIQRLAICCSLGK
ncbi:hypothetical protein H311_03537, partial [Anncaliia algerae PRA109]